jgi:NAD(P) transhydrogenase subunit alpha
MRISVPRESRPGERRVALVPESCKKLIQAGYEVSIEAGAGQAASYPDDAYRAAGVTIEADPAVLLGAADIVLQVNAPSVTGRTEVDWIRPGAIWLGSLMPLRNLEAVKALAARGITAFATDAIPRTTRAQSMDTLSSMNNIIGYKGVLLAAAELNRYFPMLMTAAGMVPPAKVFVVGAAVAGLQAIATARRLGAVVEAYDVRPAVKDQIQSLGARFVELPLETGATEDKGGYAKAQDETFYRRQRELLARVVADSDVVIGTAAVPGKKAPVLVTEDMVKGMRPGSIVVDLAAEQGGNCELTVGGETVVRHAVRIMGPYNLAATLPFHASQLYAKNLANFVLNMTKDGALQLDADDAIVRDTMLARGGEMTSPRVRELLGLAPLPV